MPMTTFAQAVFRASAGRDAEFPPEGPPEIAFVGRSNVGKSSAINAIAGRKRLAFSSKTPGRTQTINFYDLGEQGRLVDLPGYGYAKVARSARAGWERLVTGYLQERASLAGVVLVMDARRPLTPQDVRVLEWLAPLGLPCLGLLTKADKLPRAERLRALAETRKAMGEALAFSSLSREGVAECRERLAGWLLEARSGSRK
jgi:GTP-binding protein